MQISDDDIKKIAALARLEIPEGERKRYVSELSDILSYVAQLGEVDTEGVEAFDQAISASKLHEDKATNANDVSSREALLRSVPDSRDGFIVVPKVFDR